MRSHLKLGVSTFALAAISAFGATAAHAQALGGRAAADSIETVTVTGTSIRGVAPVGENLISVGQPEMEAVAAYSVNELLANVPALTGMNADGRGQNGNGGPGASVYIHQFGESADNATLVIMDGHRLPEAGSGATDNATVDPNIIPQNMLQRVDILATGTSATYGADGVAGVVNFITRKNFDGIQLHYAGELESGSSLGNLADVLIGKSWPGGSVMGSFTYQSEGNIKNIDRWKTNPLVQTQIAAQNGLATTTGSTTNFGNFNCNPAAIQPNGSGNIYLNAQSATNVANTSANFRCSQWAYADQVPKEINQHSMIKFTQDLGPNISFTGDMLYSTQRIVQQTSAGVLTATAFGSGAQANPFYVNPPGVTASKQTVTYDFNGLLPPGHLLSGNDAIITDADLVWNINSDWSLDLLASAGRDQNYNGNKVGVVNNSLALLALNGSNVSGGTIPSATATSTSVPNTQSTINNLPLTTSNALDVWNPIGSNKTSATVLKLLENPANNNTLQQGVNADEQFRAIVNGTLFTLPGGPLKIAVGVELYNTHRSDNIVTNGGAGPSTTSSDYTSFDFSRSDTAAFTEADIPIVSPEMGVPFMQKFELDAGVRTDDYNDVGRTTNPKISFNWDIIEGLRLRGNWSTSFVTIDLDHEVPPGTVVNTVSVTTTGIGTVPVALFPSVTALGIAGCTSASVSCSTSSLSGLSSLALNKNLYPEHGHGWTLGFDYTPSFLDGFVSHVDWWHANLTGGATAGSLAIDESNPLAVNRIMLFPGCATQAQITAATYGAVVTSSLPTCVSYIVNSATANLLNYWASGLDINLQYKFDTDVGLITVVDDLSQALTFQAGYGVPQLVGVPPAYLRSEINNSVGLQPAAPNVGTQMRAHIDWALDNFFASFSMNFTGAYRNVSNTATALIGTNSYGIFNGTGGDHVAAQATFNMHLAYNFQSDILGNDQLSLTVNNLLNEYPTFYNSSTGWDQYTSSPIGRIITLGLTTKF